MRTTVTFSIPETRLSRRVDFIIGKAPTTPLGVVVTVSEATKACFAFIWFANARRPLIQRNA